LGGEFLSEEPRKNINASGNKQGELFWFENCFSFHKTARLLVEIPPILSRQSYQPNL
jgi:hypothetical protein